MSDLADYIRAKVPALASQSDADLEAYAHDRHPELFAHAAQTQSPRATALAHLSANATRDASGQWHPSATGGDVPAGSPIDASAPNVQPQQIGFGSASIHYTPSDQRSTEPGTNDVGIGGIGVGATGRKVLAAIGDAGIGVGKAAVETAVSLGDLLRKHPVLSSLIVPGVNTEAIPDSPDLHSALEGRNLAEKTGKFVERTAEFAGGEQAVRAGVQAVPMLAEAAAASPKIAKAMQSFVAGSGVAGAEGATPWQAAAAGIASAGIPALFDLGGTALKRLGMKFITANIRPTAVDTANAGVSPGNDSWLADRLNKYGLVGDSVKNTFANVHGKIVALAEQLREITQGANTGDVAAGAEAEGPASMTRAELNDSAPAFQRGRGQYTTSAHRASIQDAIASGQTVPPKVLAEYPDLANQARMAGTPGPKVDLNSMIDQVESNLLSRSSQLNTGAAEIKGVRETLNEYRNFVNNLPGGPEALVDEAQTFKRMVGTDGAWAYGKSGADKGREIVSNALYSQLKGTIEKATADAPRSIQQINKQLGELIPVEQAVIRRIPVAARQQVLSLTDWAAILTGHPVAAAAHVVSKTMAGAGKTFAAGTALSKAGASTITPAIAGATANAPASQ